MSPAGVLAFSAAFCLLVIAAELAASLASWAGYEPAPYRMIEAADGFELREYPDLTLVKTRREDDAAAFMRLAEYLHGFNAAHRVMTMTIPIFSLGDSMGLVLSGCRSDNAPPPLSTGLSIDTLRPGRVLVSRVQGRLTRDQEKSIISQMEAWLERQGLQKSVRPLMHVFYDPPWIPDVFRRSEIMLAVEERR